MSASQGLLLQKLTKFVVVANVNLALMMFLPLCQRHATSPISYVFGFDNANHIKDITPRYVQHWNTVSRMLRVETKWLDKALKPFQATKSAREKQEDEELNKIDIDKPLPTTIAE